MEFNHIFFDDGIIDIIFEGLTYHDRLRFSHVNQYTYITYHQRVKFLIHEFMNRDYKLFKKWIKVYTYTKEELKYIFLKVSCQILIVEVTSPLSYGNRSITTYYYDLRYIFELIYAGLNYHDKEINDHYIQSNLTLIMDTIQRCISFDRYETIHNINQQIILYPLHRLFNPSYSWEYI